MFKICDGCCRPIKGAPYELVRRGGSILELHDHECLRTWKARQWDEALKSVRTPAEMRRFMDDPASDPELARSIADAARFMLRLMAPEGCNSNPPKNGSEVQHIDGCDFEHPHPEHPLRERPVDG